MKFSVLFLRSDGITNAIALVDSRPTYTLTKDYSAIGVAVEHIDTLPSGSTRGLKVNGTVLDANTYVTSSGTINYYNSHGAWIYVYTYDFKEGDIISYGTSRENYTKRAGIFC